MSALQPEVSTAVPLHQAFDGGDTHRAAAEGRATAAAAAAAASAAAALRRTELPVSLPEDRKGRAGSPEVSPLRSHVHPKVQPKQAHELRVRRRT